MLTSLYEERRSKFAYQQEKITKQIAWISYARLFTAAAFLTFFYFGLTYHSYLYLLPVIVFVFIALVRKHATLFEASSHLQNLAKINQSERQALEGDLSNFSNGAPFINSQHPYSHDLDIFGEGSLYQFTNRCNTIIGKKKFASRLTTPLASDENITINQKAIQEVAAMIDFRQNFQAAGMEMNEQQGDREQLLAWLKQPARLFGKATYQFILILVPMLTAGFIVASFFSDNFRPFAILLVIFQWVFLGFHVKYINAFHDYISRKKSALQKYANLLKYLQAPNFSSLLMSKLSSQAQDAGKKVENLASLVHALDARLNFLTTMLMNSIFLYDLQCVYRLEKWKEKNAQNLNMWLEAISDTEVIISFGTFAYNNPSFNYANIHSSLSISAKALGHPLIAQNECIVNDFQIGNGPSILIITGANMAGKSTFLRTLGINLVLALNGAPVCAQEFICPIIHMRSGMRTADSLKDHQSYFYAELDRLKGIMDELRRDIPLLILLDEILKGTNSTDKQAGSIALVKQLMPHPCLAIIATHDLALGELENQFPDKVKNYSFEANIENDQLSFDYKLKEGIAQKMNATFLMRKMGIIPVE